MVNQLTRKTVKVQTSFGEDCEVYFTKNYYKNNGNVAIQIYETTGEPFASLTVNIETLPDKVCTVDCNNLYCNVLDVLEKLDLIKPYGLFVPSGFCLYPVYELTDDFLEEWCA